MESSEDENCQKYWDKINEECENNQPEYYLCPKVLNYDLTCNCDDDIQHYGRILKHYRNFITKCSKTYIYKEPFIKKLDKEIYLIEVYVDRIEEDLRILKAKLKSLKNICNNN